MKRSLPLLFGLLLISVYSFCQNSNEYSQTYTLKAVKFDTENNLIESESGDIIKLIEKIKKDATLELIINNYVSDSHAKDEAEKIIKTRTKSIRKAFVDNGIKAYRVMPGPGGIKTGLADDMLVEIGVRKAKPDAMFDKARVISNIKFSNLSDTLYASSYTELNKLAKVLNMKPSMKVKIISHTSTLAGSEYNKNLSIRRAEAVKNYLAPKIKNPERIVIEGMGDSHPLVLNDTESGRAKNSRVEIAFGKK